MKKALRFKEFESRIDNYKIEETIIDLQ